MKEMAALLRKGAKMLSINCPECSSPLFQLKTGEILCPSCRREVKVLEAGEDAEKVTLSIGLERTLTAKLQLIQRRLEAEEDPERIKSLTETLTTLFSALRQLRADERPSKTK
jgi:UPF0148 protein